MREVRWIPVATLSNGHEFGLSVHSVQGSGDGPRVGVVAGAHGDEPLTVETVRRLLLELEQLPLRGTVTAIPCMNPYALHALARHTPVDGADLNRQFPGDPDGTFSQQLAHAIWREVSTWDYLIDYHGSGNDSTVDYLYMHDDEPLAKSFGCEVLFQGISHPGSLGRIATDNGIPSLVSELGGGQQRNSYYLEKGVRGGLNVLKHLNLLYGDPELPERQVVVTEKVMIMAHNGGLMVSEFDADNLCETVSKDTVLARIYHTAALEEIETVRAPFDESILLLVRDRFSTVDVGDYCFIAANGAGARVA